MSKKNRDRGKRLERFLANDLKGRRIGLLGKEDVQLDRFSIECKERKKMPTFLKKSMKQAFQNCEDGKAPVLILHEHDQPHGLDLVIMYYVFWKDFKEIKNVENKN